MTRILYIIRGISGSGKTTFANTLGCPVFSADDFFMRDGEYKFDPKFLPQAHDYCRVLVQHAMYAGTEKIAVANTFTEAWEFEQYIYLAEANDYTVFTIIVENRHGGKNVHDVPDASIEKQRQRFEVKL